MKQSHKIDKGTLKYIISSPPGLRKYVMHGKMWITPRHYLDQISGRSTREMSQMLQNLIQANVDHPIHSRWRLRWHAASFPGGTPCWFDAMRHTIACYSALSCIIVCHVCCGVLYRRKWCDLSLCPSCLFLSSPLLSSPLLFSSPLFSDMAYLLLNHHDDIAHLSDNCLFRSQVNIAPWAQKLRCGPPKPPHPPQPPT